MRLRIKARVWTVILQPHNGPLFSMKMQNNKSRPAGAYRDSIQFPEFRPPGCRRDFNIFINDLDKPLKTHAALQLFT